LRAFYKAGIPSYKESKKKFEKALADLETQQGKYLAIKKSCVRLMEFFLLF